MLIIVNEANAMVLYALLTSAAVVLGLLLLRVTLGSHAMAVVERRKRLQFHVNRYSIW